MTQAIKEWRRCIAAAVALVCALPIIAQADDEEIPTLTIGFFDLTEDIRYDEWGIHPVDIRSSLVVDRRALAGARLGALELERLRRVAKTKFALNAERVADSRAVRQGIERMRAEGVSLFLLDASAAVVAEVAVATRDLGILLFNTTAGDDTLRNEFCQPHVLHTAPSDAMLVDAVAQYLVSRKWRDVLVLQGPLDQDAAMAASFERSAELFGLDIVDVRRFVLGTDPRARDQNDLEFLTGNEDYDAVFVADVHGEFALGVPYRTREPAVVTGASGLVPRAWHWSYMRHGAPQVHGRFERLTGRRMQSADWGAWVAMKAIGEAVVRSRSFDVGDITDYLRGAKLRLDGSKGAIMSFRPWNNQLRQSILLGNENWITAVAPISGFKHRVNDLDTLGYEERESRCAF